MIGGIDIVLANETRDDAEALDAVVRAMARRWTAAIFEDPDTGRVFDSVEDAGAGRRARALSLSRSDRASRLGTGWLHPGTRRRDDPTRSALPES